MLGGSQGLLGGRISSQLARGAYVPRDLVRLRPTSSGHLDDSEVTLRAGDVFVLADGEFDPGLATAMPSGLMHAGSLD